MRQGRCGKRSGGSWSYCILIKEVEKVSKKLGQAINQEVLTSSSEALPLKGSTNCPNSTRSWTTSIQTHELPIWAILQSYHNTQEPVVSTNFYYLNSFLSHLILMLFFLLLKQMFYCIFFTLYVLVVKSTCHIAEACGGQISPSAR